MTGRFVPLSRRPRAGLAPAGRPWASLLASLLAFPLAFPLALTACTSETADYCDDLTPCGAGYRCNVAMLTCVAVPRASADRGPGRGGSDGSASRVGGDAAPDAGRDAVGPGRADRDGDGDPDLTDCAPDNAAVAHGKAETCNQGVDDDCDGVADGVDSQGCLVYYADRDGDGFGAAGEGQCLCAPKAPHLVINDRDCGDGDADIKPGARERCNSKDDDCDQLTDEADGPLPPIGCEMFYPDADHDGRGAAAGGKCLCAGTDEVPATNHEDCYDGNAEAKPGQTKFFERDRGDGSFDFDCDGAAQQERAVRSNGRCTWTTNFGGIGLCLSSGGGGGTGTVNGWRDDVPACGRHGYFFDKCEGPAGNQGGTASTCRAVYSEDMVVQRCR